ncbi:arylsulfatase A-like enzyme [Dyadobacter sp. BE34]|uniref:Arylsulfatase A-like enzyme n=1 Tax=Dyadobacter fermentans TaxID=94254 RepID=A0ABU1R273_9BACT|nr:MULTISPECIES: sulfatase-like hydrolase/transferase [Dyadobacter]MDR6807332.1 arylsulfatase A-like enzyme [Dyadobacter fermentans]MDR7045073.1 arylsulfatase A-like enzyme [Dyadobacter sp. BE242]MDR7199191.1 arylsulfatase A-like enzyme [Dyadobacter sp. BE34]MDR7217151.1 arylsulfatase A-like enzyme [Dyadobacter sp. BE31]MDR7265084.1 arylsulfatase A-like enzyme [Dyadobacter sp. BE32]
MHKLTRKILLAILIIALRPALAQDRPNILWIVSEDNTILLGSYGDKFATTPNLDQFATESIRYKNAFSTAPVCAPSRNTLITGMYPPSLGTEHMRSTYPSPAFVKFFPKYLREAGYYTTNNAKKDYNTPDQLDAWDESSNKATYKNRKPGQPFFAVFNLNVSHESSLHEPLPALKHDPEKVPLPPYHPATPELKHDWAQYYDKLEEMDRQFGKLLQELKDEGLAENTIVFYYADNGGVLARSKRFMYESGLHVPLIVHLPPKYAHLATQKQGSVSDRLVTFLDFAPTVLSLVDIKVPDYMQGGAFLGKQQKPEPSYAYGFRGRMDERIDMSRSVRDKKFRYIRNYLPNKIYGQYLEYLWRAPSVKSWEDLYKAGKLNAVQSKFWEQKPAEELFDVDADPHNIHNLAGDPKYQKELTRLRNANEQWIKSYKDVGFIPEAIIYEIAKTTPLYDYARSGKYDLNKIAAIADQASSRNPANTQALIKALVDADASVRYWGATGLTVLKAASGKVALQKALKDPEVSVRIAAAEALYVTGTDKPGAIAALTDALKSDNPYARLQALNVLDLTGKDAAPALPETEKISEQKAEMFDYDIRAAKVLLQNYKSSK